MRCGGLLGGPWVVINGVISRVTRVMTHLRGFITLRITNVAARLVGPPPPPTKTFGLNSVEPGAPLGGLAQDVITFD